LLLWSSQLFGGLLLNNLKELGLGIFTHVRRVYLHGWSAVFLRSGDGQTFVFAVFTGDLVAERSLVIILIFTLAFLATLVKALARLLVLNLFFFRLFSLLVRMRIFNLLLEVSLVLNWRLHAVKVSLVQTFTVQVHLRVYIIAVRRWFLVLIIVGGFLLIFRFFILLIDL